MNSVNRYLKNKKIPMEMQMRIRKYLEYIQENKQRSQIDESSLMSKISSCLRDDLVVEINGKIIE